MTPPVIRVFVGGRDVTLEQTCPIVLPKDLAGLGYPLAGDDVVLKHFAATIKSKRAITVKAGITLSLGAELIKTDPVADPGDADRMMNFTQATAYDDYGQVISQSRNYFDEQGKPTQSQYRNLSVGAVMAQATLYDATGRAAISTLPAPVRARTGAESTDDCGKTIRFAYKPDFVRAPDGQVYDYPHFDLAREESPLAVNTSQEGTLGWYYSTNNGTSANARLNDPYLARRQQGLQLPPLASVAGEFF